MSKPLRDIQLRRTGIRLEQKSVELIAIAALGAGVLVLGLGGELRVALGIVLFDFFLLAALFHFYAPSEAVASGADYILTPCVLWFTGLPSAGKTTLAALLKESFESEKIKIEHLDGDAVRSVVTGIGFSRDERNNHIRRMGFLASRFELQGITVIASFVSPYRESRDFTRNICKNFIEIYLSTDVTECTRRDVKGLYKEAQSGKRAQMTGVDDPYEPPLSPEIVLDTAKLSKDECVAAIKNFLILRGLLRESAAPIHQAVEYHGSSFATRAR